MEQDDRRRGARQIERLKTPASDVKVSNWQLGTGN
jgi:hypothetical protein